MLDFDHLNSSKNIHKNAKDKMVDRILEVENVEILETAKKAVFSNYI